MKVVQSWSRSPFFEYVPEEMKEFAEASVPWRTEPLAYRSDLGDRLPDGLAMPRAVGVFDLDEKSASVWLEKVAVVPRPWDDARYERAAYLLGRLSGSPRVAELGRVGRALVHDGRLRVRPARQPGGPDAPRRRRLAAPADRGERSATSCATGCGRRRASVPAYVEEVLALPHLAAHGDACPNNLLTTAATTRLHADRLRVLDADARRRRPRPAAHRRRPDRQAARRRPGRARRRPHGGVRAGACATRAATSPSPSSAAPTPFTC